MVAWAGGVRGGPSRKDSKGVGGDFGSDGRPHSLDRGVGFVGAYIRQNL